MEVQTLQRVLRSVGVLPAGRVLDLQFADTGAFNAHVLRLRVRYSADSPPDAPTALIAKQPTSDAWSRRAAVTEARFYELAGRLDDHPPVLAPCVAADAGQDPLLLLIDLSATHGAPLSRADEQSGSDAAVPAEMRIGQVVDALSWLHGYWWNHPMLDQVEAPYWSAAGEGFVRYRDRRRRSWLKIRNEVASRLSDRVVDLYDRVFERLDGHWASWLGPRVVGDHGLTLLHGDAYFSNFLCPHDPSKPAVLLDWQSPSSGLGAADLVNLCATFWTAQQRADGQRELRVLQRYHAQLEAVGVTDYSFDDLCLDYRLALVYWILVPVQDAHDGAGPEYWAPKMRNLTAAFDNWNCEQLLT